MENYFLLSLIFFIISLISAKYKSRSQIYLILNTSAVILYFLISITYFSANFFTGHGVDNSVIYTLQYGLGDAGFGDYILLIVATVTAVIITFAIGYLYYRFIKHYNHPKPSKIKGFIHNTFLLLAFVSHPLLHNLWTIYSYRSIKHSNDFYKYYKKPTPHKESLNHKNIVYIYAESLERTYFDEKRFPNLITNLRKFQNQSIDFSNIQQVIGTGWTIGGYTATQCAIPLFTPSNGNSMSGVDTFLPGAVCLGDVLHNLGYHQVYIQGASTKFSGKDKFFKTHHFDEIYGRDELEDRLKDKSYLNAWGLYDDSTFDIAFEKFLELSKKSKPFMINVMTLDTHHPDGHLSKTCRELGIRYGKGDNPILNAVKCSDYLISDFISKIKQSKYAKDTIILLTSDHLAMKNTATHILKRGPRRDLFLILEPNNREHTIIDKPTLMFDQASILLDRIGADTDLGLGRDVLREKSLLEEFGDNIHKLNKKLYSWREDILKFWSFPKLPKSIRVNLSNRVVDVANHQYKLPLFIEVKDDKTINPHFEFYSYEKEEFLPYQITQLPKDREFIWIDKCNRINFVYKSSINSYICVAKGNLKDGVDIEGVDSSSSIETAIDKKSLYRRDYNQTVERLKSVIDMHFIEPVYIASMDKSYDNSLEEGIEFKKEGYPNFIKRVWGVSGREKWGRWSDANLAPSVKFQFKDKLPKSFILELKVGGYGSNIGREAVVKIGNEEKRFKIESYSPKVYRLEFNNVNSDIVEITPPNPTSPKRDKRKLGISFVKLKILR